MYKIIIIVLLYLVVVNLNSKSSIDETRVEQEKRITLLSYCEAKFEYLGGYYAICPYDKTLNLSYQEYVEFNKPVQAAPDAFIKAESNERKSLIMAMILVVLLVFIGFLFLIQMT